MRRAHGQQPCAGEVTASTSVRLGELHVGNELLLYECRMAKGVIRRKQPYKNPNCVKYEISVPESSQDARITGRSQMNTKALHPLSDQQYLSISRSKGTT